MQQASSHTYEETLFRSIAAKNKKYNQAKEKEKIQEGTHCRSLRRKEK